MTVDSGSTITLTASDLKKRQRKASSLTRVVRQVRRRLDHPEQYRPPEVPMTARLLIHCRVSSWCNLHRHMTVTHVSKNIHRDLIHPDIAWMVNCTSTSTRPYSCPPQRPVLTCSARDPVFHTTAHGIYKLTTHLVPAAYPRLTPDIPLPEIPIRLHPWCIAR